MLSPRVDISAVALSTFVLDWAKKNQNQNQKISQSGVFVSWRFTTLAKLSVNAINVVTIN